MRAPVLILATALGLGVAASLWLRPWNPEYLADRAEEVLDRRGAAGRAEAADLFRQALAREPASPYRWCDLGETLAAAGQPTTAAYCFRRAVDLGPRIPPILMRAANFHFAAGRFPEALACTQRVLSLVREYDAIVFATYARMHVPPEQVLESGLPPATAPRQAYFRHVLGTRDLREADLAWSWLERTDVADPGIAIEYCNFLLENHEYAHAGALWARNQGGRSPGYPQSNRVFNGGFESEPARTGLDWQIAVTDGVLVERVSTPTHGGGYSLRVTFGGGTNPAYGGVVERVVVEPGDYRFRAFIRAEGITTDQGVRFVISDPDTPGHEPVSTRAVTGSVEWSELSTSVVVRGRTRLLEIRLSRAPSLKFDDKIRGTVWIDDVELIPSK